MRRSRCLSLAAVLALSLAAVAAQEEERPWSDTAELSLIVTTGNSETENFAFANEFLYKWDLASLTVRAAALRTNTTSRSISNEPGGLVVIDESETTAESYFVDGVYRREISERFYWYGGTSWERNIFAGIDARYKGFGGVGYLVLEREKQTLAVEFGGDYTREEQISGLDDEYAGLRAFVDYHHDINETTKFKTNLELLENLDDTDDLRARWVSSITASLTQKLALKASYTVLFDNQPVEVLIAGDPTTMPPTPARVFEFDDVDTIFSTSLVLNF